MVLFIFIYSLLGMELFAYQARFNSDMELDFGPDSAYPQSTFNNLA
jgi:hypothetical protein